MNARVLGKSISKFPGELDTWSAPQGLETVTFESEELTALCPVTSQPDLYSIDLTYFPKALIVESKSLKLYFNSFRDRGISTEGLACEIAEFVGRALEAVTEVTVRQHVRGGLTLTAVSAYSPDGEGGGLATDFDAQIKLAEVKLSQLKLGI